LQLLRVCSVRRATPSSRIVRLSTSPRSFHYRAGQWARIGPRDSRAYCPYSIASSPEETARHRWIEFLIKTDAQDRWGDAFPPLARSQQLAVRGPLGRFTFPDHTAERRFLFIAGGTGIAPLRSMIRHARAVRPEADCRLLYSARTPDDFAYLPQLRGMARRGELQLALTATRAASDTWRGGSGRITASQLAPLVDTKPILCFVCGPAAMVASVPEMLVALGVERGRIKVEEWE
jgi:CDP-4-dehydro-6-deoxyglucose reductase